MYHRSRTLSHRLCHGGGEQLLYTSDENSLRPKIDVQDAVHELDAKRRFTQKLLVRPAILG